MDTYMLTGEGRARFRRMKTAVDVTMARMEGYEVLQYLYEIGAGNVQEIGENINLPQDKVMARLMTFMNQGLVERMQ